MLQENILKYKICVKFFWQWCKSSAASVSVIALLRYHPVFTSNKTDSWIKCVLFAGSHFQISIFLLYTNEPAGWIMYLVFQFCLNNGLLFLWHFHLHNLFQFFTFSYCISSLENPLTSFPSIPPSARLSPSASPSLPVSPGLISMCSVCSVTL